MVVAIGSELRELQQLFVKQLHRFGVLAVNHDRATLRVRVEGKRNSMGQQRLKRLAPGHLQLSFDHRSSQQELLVGRRLDRHLVGRQRLDLLAQRMVKDR